MSLANDYRPTKWEDVTEQGLTVKILKNICEQDTLSCRNFLLTGPAGTGKAQPMDSRILTPHGYIMMKDVQIGTEVYTHTGAISKVTGVYPQGIRPIYEITLSDKSKIRVSDEHLNLVYRYNTDKKLREDYVLSTVELINLFHRSRFKLRIDIPTVDWVEQSLPIDPYLLGLLIGDGSLTANNLKFTNSEPDVLQRMNAILRRDWGCYLHKLPGDTYDYSISPIEVVRDGSMSGAMQLKNALASLDLNCKSIDKHIPSMYLLNSKSNRLALLQGLFDTDGCICKQSRGKGVTSMYYTSSARLSEDFAFLVRSLGIRDTICVKSHTGYVSKKTNAFVPCNDCYAHLIKVPHDMIFFMSDKHGSRWDAPMYAPMRNIETIEYVGDMECQCIYVDHEDHTYISDNFIPTHNTTLARLMAKKLNDGIDNSEIIELDAASHSGVDDIREIIAQAQSYPVVGKYKCILIDECHSLSDKAWQALLCTLESSPARTIFFLATTNPEKIPKTITSRVQQFQLSKISLQGIEDRLKYVLDNEIAKGASYTYTDDGISLIAKLANGGMRDALTLLDKLLVYSTEVTSESATASLVSFSYDDFFMLLGAIAKQDNAKIAEVIDTVYGSGTNFVRWFENFHSFVINVAKYVVLQDITKTMIPTHYNEKLSKYNMKHYTICLKLANLLMTLNQELRATNYQQEVALTRLCVIPKKAGETK